MFPGKMIGYGHLSVISRLFVYPCRNLEWSFAIAKSDQRLSQFGKQYRRIISGWKQILERQVIVLIHACLVPSRIFSPAFNYSFMDDSSGDLQDLNRRLAPDLLGSLINCIQDLPSGTCVVLLNLSKNTQTPWDLLHRNITLHIISSLSST